LIKKLFIISFILLSTYHTVYAISAESAILIDADSGRVLFEKNAHTKRGIASTTKILTAIVVLENASSDEVVNVSYKAANTEGSSMYLKSGEKITVENLLYGLMLNSGNDAATALAEHTAGSVEEFAKLMNKKAKEIGMNSSSFANPHGLDNENHYSTAYDMAMLTKYAMENKTFKNIVGTKTKIAKNENGDYKYLTNHNKLLSIYEYCLGVKTGFTKKCGRCLVSFSEKNGVKLIAITLNAPNDWNDHIKLYDEYFSIYKRYNIIDINNYVASINIENADDTDLKLYNCKAINLTLKDEEYKKIKIKYNIKDNVKVPIYKGQILGEINIMLDNKIIASSPVASMYGIQNKKTTTCKDNIIFLLNNLLSLFYKNI